MSDAHDPTELHARAIAGLERERFELKKALLDMTAWKDRLLEVNHAVENEMQKCAATVLLRADKAEVSLSMLREAVEACGAEFVSEHDDSCAAVVGAETRDVCDCGFDEAERLRAALRATSEYNAGGLLTRVGEYVYCQTIGLGLDQKSVDALAPKDKALIQVAVRAALWSWL